MPKVLQVRDLAIAAGAYMAETICIVAASRMVPVFPRVRIRIVSSNWSEVPRLVIAREASFGLLDLRGMNDDPGLEVERLRPQPGFFVVRPGHPLAGRADIGLAEILAYPMAFIGRIPAVADHFDWDEYRFEVVDMDKNRIDKVLVARLAAPDEYPTH